MRRTKWTVKSCLEGSNPGDPKREVQGLVLASRSPRRIELLSNLGLAFEVMPSHIEENVDLQLAPENVVVQLAEAKAGVVAKHLVPGPGQEIVVLGADTIVVIDGEIIGKPQSAQEAISMLAKLSGRWHQVYTGVALLRLPDLWSATSYEVSKVYIRELAAKEIDSYIATGESMDKAGAYALQGIASAFVEKIDGCFTNVIGLPMPQVVHLLRQAGVSVLGIP